MEDCIDEAPDAFIEGFGTMVARQGSIAGFRPDLLFRDTSGKLCILEIQKQALDRSHLYKCLEYRDLVHEREGGDPPRVILFCESLPDRYSRAIATHGIETIVMPRAEFISAAVRRCPESLERHLLSGIEPIEAESERPAIPSEMEPFDWRDHCDVEEVFDHFSRQLGRMGMGRFDLPLPYQQDIYLSLYRFLDGPFLYGHHAELRDFRYWDLKRLFKPWGNETVEELVLSGSPHSGNFRKPAIYVAPYITQKGNLSVIWQPRETPHGSGDFRFWRPYTEAYQRPPNELMFIRSVQYLNISISDRLTWRHPENVRIIDELLVCLMRASFNALVQGLRVFCDVELVSDFEFDLEDTEKDRSGISFASGSRVIDWRIYNIEDRKRRAEQEWFEGFEKSYGLTVNAFVEGWVAEASVPRRSARNAYKYLPRRFVQMGLEIDARTCKSVMERLSIPQHRWRLPESLRPIDPAAS